MNVLELFGQMYPTRFVQKIESESQFFRLFHLSQWSFVSVSTMSWKKIDNFSSKRRISVGEPWLVVCPTRLSGSQRIFSKVPEDNAASHVTLSIFGRRWPQDCEESFRFRLRTVPKSTDERRERTWPSYPTLNWSRRECWKWVRDKHSTQKFFGRAFSESTVSLTESDCRRKNTRCRRWRFNESQNCSEETKFDEFSQFPKALDRHEARNYEDCSKCWYVQMKWITKTRFYDVNRSKLNHRR